MNDLKGEDKGQPKAEQAEEEAKLAEEAKRKSEEAYGAAVKKAEEDLEKMLEGPHMELWSKALGSEGVDALCQVLEGNEKISVLSLCANNIGPRGARSVARLLPTMPKIRIVDLYGNPIEDQGVLDLCEVIRKVQPPLGIHALILSDCQLTDTSVFRLAEVFSSLPALRELHIGGNSLSDAAVHALCERLSNPELHTRLNVIDLAGCKVSGPAVNVLARLLRGDVAKRMEEFCRKPVDPAVEAARAADQKDWAGSKMWLKKPLAESIPQELIDRGGELKDGLDW